MADSIKFTPSKTIRDFMLCNDFFRVVKGPYGSGKTTGCIMEVLRRCVQMPPCPDGLRRSRWVFARNTRSQMKDTLLRSVFELLPQGIGTWKESDFIYTLRFNDVHAEWLFRSLDTPEDIQRLLSLQLTGLFIEEAREIPVKLVLEAQTRLRRFPRRQDVPDYWSGMICATNPPEIDSDWYKLMEHLPQIEDEPGTVVPVTMFMQPSAMSPEAENLEFLHPNYYTDLMKGKAQDWIDTNIHNLYSQSQYGKPVYHQSFKVDRHVAKNALKIDGNLPVIVGMDCARTPAAVFKQMQPDGRIFTLREAYGFDMGAKTFISQKLNPIIRNYFPNNPLIFVGDPSWVRQNETDDNSWYKELKKFYTRDTGHTVKPSATNDPIARINATDQALRTYPDGEPLFQIDPSCKWLIEALRSKYRYAKLKGTDGKLHERPEKNNWSHTAEANQYADMFILGGHYHPEDYVRVQYNPLNQRTSFRPADSIMGY